MTSTAAELAPPSPNLRATPTGDHLSTTDDLGCNRRHAGRVCSGIVFRSCDPPVQVKTHHYATAASDGWWEGRIYQCNEVGCDRTSVTQVSKEVLYVTEVILNRPPQWLVCQLHANELLRHIFAMDGTTNRSRSLTGEIRKLWPDARSSLVSSTPIEYTLCEVTNKKDLSMINCITKFEDKKLLTLQRKSVEDILEKFATQGAYNRERILSSM
ncbi:hypothetical protein AVEN_5272-1 [Araneus ventricosus]|uniref:Uncharacterized protein n=1 Tax=Araneus ventricosus TaxID=182803 RepID=A0A4Y2SXG8_ARAVE|nr:hypothetical protein AVEN_5272-1 [Araneus ventricosus]